MAPSSTKQKGAFRRGYVRIKNIGQKFHRSSGADERSGKLPQNSTAQPSISINTRPSSQASKASRKSSAIHDVAHDARPDQAILPVETTSQEAKKRLAVNDGPTLDIVSSDIWSAAYREAVQSLGNDVNRAILVGGNVEQLFKELEEIDRDVTQESVFMRGVAYLRSIQVPLEHFKLALDLASPLTNIDPTASIAFGVVRSVTAIAISFATADLEFAKLIAEMLKQLRYIDECDAMGQRTNKVGIHKALVAVYKKLLEFYGVAHDILTRRGRKLAMKMILETNHLPSIVEEFLKEIDHLRDMIANATREVVEEIKSMLYDDAIFRWLSESKLLQQSPYHGRLKQLRANEACVSLLEHPNFKTWYSAADSQQLALSGDMGSGKTVAMSFLIDELNRRSENLLPRPKVCWYYCRDNETGAAVPILSSLIMALLEQLRGLKKTFHEWYEEKQECGVPYPATIASHLEDFLERVVPTLDRLLFIVVDGLDECDAESRRSLVRLMSKLSAKTPRLKVLLSSRPNQEILEELNQALTIEMETDTHRDAVIVRHTIESRLPSLSEEVKTLVTEKLSNLAQGSAIWTKMVIELIVKRKIWKITPMQQFLKSMPLPDQLSTLYINLILQSSSDDSENLGLIIAALKLLAAACRPFSMEELAWAVALATAQHDVKSVAALSELVNSEGLMALIQPFITRIDFTDVKKRQVQLVHQSVKEFVIREWPKLHDLAPTTQPHTTNVHHHEHDLEDFMLSICIDYLLLDEIGNTTLFSEDQLAILALPQDVDLFDDEEIGEYDPKGTWEAYEAEMNRFDPTERGFGEFFVYASSYWLKHFGAVGTHDLPDVAKIERLCEAGSTRIQNWTEQSVRPDCTMLERYPFPSELYDPLSITALYGTDAMLRHMLEHANFEADTYLPATAMSTADQILQWGDLSKVPASSTGDLSKLKILFVEGQLTPQLRNVKFFKLLMKQSYELRYRHDDWDLAFDLVKNVLESMVEKSWGNELLCAAASVGCLPIVQRLTEYALHNEELRAELSRGHEVLAEAIIGNDCKVVEHLLGQKGFEAHLEYTNARGENLLHLASRLCNPEIFGLLAPRLRNHIDRTDHNGDTPVMRIVKSPAIWAHRCNSMKILLPYVSVASLTQGTDRRENPLRAAACLGDIVMTQVLLDDGRMNPVSLLVRSKDGCWTLKERPDILQLEEEILATILKHVDVVSSS